MRVGTRRSTPAHRPVEAVGEARRRGDEGRAASAPDPLAPPRHIAVTHHQRSRLLTTPAPPKKKMCTTPHGAGRVQRGLCAGAPMSVFHVTLAGPPPPPP